MNINIYIYIFTKNHTVYIKYIYHFNEEFDIYFITFVKIN